MLVLTRREDQRILVGDDIVITLVRLGSYAARIGIDAPPDVDIRREEVPELERDDIYSERIAKLKEDVARLQAILDNWIPMPQIMGGWGEPDAPDDAVALIREACEIRGVDFSEHQRLVAAQLPREQPQ